MEEENKQKWKKNTVKCYLIIHPTEHGDSGLIFLTPNLIIKGDPGRLIPTLD